MDVTKILLRSAADWIAEALAQASAEGTELIGACLQRETGDLTVTLQLKRGQASLYACAVGMEPTLIVSADVPALTSGDVVNFPTPASDRLQ